MNCPKCDHENSTEDSVKQVAELLILRIIKDIDKIEDVSLTRI